MEPAQSLGTHRRRTRRGTGPALGPCRALALGLVLLVSGAMGAENLARSPVPKATARSWDANSGPTAGYEPRCAIDGDADT